MRQVEVNVDALHHMCAALLPGHGRARRKARSSTSARSRATSRSRATRPTPRPRPSSIPSPKAFTPSSRGRGCPAPCSVRAGPDRVRRRRGPERVRRRGSRASSGPAPSRWRRQESTGCTRASGWSSPEFTSGQWDWPADWRRATVILPIHAAGHAAHARARLPRQGARDRLPAARLWPLGGRANQGERHGRGRDRRRTRRLLPATLSGPRRSRASPACCSATTPASSPARCSSSITPSTAHQLPVRHGRRRGSDRRGLRRLGLASRSPTATAAAA